MSRWNSTPTRCVWRRDAKPTGPRCERTFYREAPAQVCCHDHGAAYGYLTRLQKRRLIEAAREEAEA